MFPATTPLPHPNPPRFFLLKLMPLSADVNLNFLQQLEPKDCSFTQPLLVVSSKFHNGPLLAPAIKKDNKCYFRGLTQVGLRNMINNNTYITYGQNKIKALSGKHFDPLPVYRS